MVGVGLALLELDHLISAEHTVGTEESRLKYGMSNSGERSVHCWLSQVIKYQSVLSPSHFCLLSSLIHRWACTNNLRMRLYTQLSFSIIARPPFELL